MITLFDMTQSMLIGFMFEAFGKAVGWTIWVLIVLAIAIGSFVTGPQPLTFEWSDLWLVLFTLIGMGAGRQFNKHVMGG